LTWNGVVVTDELFEYERFEPNCSVPFAGIAA